MKNFLKVVMVIGMVLCTVVTFASCGAGSINENFDYFMDYFQDKIVEEEQEMVHCDIVNNDDGYMLTYSYVDAGSTYVVVITFDEECVITRYDIYSEGTYENRIVA